MSSLTSFYAIYPQFHFGATFTPFLTTYLLTLWSKCTWTIPLLLYASFFPLLLLLLPLFLLFLFNASTSITLQKQTTFNYEKLLKIVLNLTNWFDILPRFSLPLNREWVWVYMSIEFNFPKRFCHSDVVWLCSCLSVLVNKHNSNAQWIARDFQPKIKWPNK